MKKNILKIMIVAGLIALSADLRAFTAVASGAWSSAATWGGVGPGATVSGQDIIIPSGITVDMDVDVTFTGLANSFWVTGTLNSTVGSDLTIVQGTLTGSGTIGINKLTLELGATFFAYTGSIMVDVLRNEGTIMNLSGYVSVNDTLDLEAGSVIMGVGSNLELMPNSNVRVNSGVLINNGGMLTASGPYDVWYYGITKIASQELNTAWIRDVHVLLNSNGEDVILSNNILINGDLDMVAGHLALGGYSLTLHGDYTANPGALFESSGGSDMTISGPGPSLSSPLNFSVGSSLDELTISRSTYTTVLQSELTITNSLNLGEGQLVIGATGNLVMNSGSIVHRSAGDLINNGSFDGTQQYSVQYVGDSLHTGVELTGSGLYSLVISLWNNNYLVILEDDITVDGNFILQNGQFKLNGHDIAFEGSYDQETSAAIWGDLNSTMTMSMSSSVNDTLTLLQAFYPLDKLIIDIPQGSVLTLGANLFTLELSLMSGSLDVGNSVLKIGGATPIITGANDTNYIMTRGYGWVWINVTADDPYMVFPVGTASNYAPLAIRQVSPGTTGYVKVRVFDGVWTNGNTGIDVSTTGSVVNKTWGVLADSGMVFNMDVMSGWGLGCEVNGFDRTSCHVKNYYNNAWSGYTNSPAMVGSFNTYTSSRVALQNDGFFAVVDGNGPLGMTETPITTMNVYPNPATEQLTIENPNPAKDMFTYEMYDATGRLVMSMTNANERNVIDMTQYDNGVYTIRITNTMTSEVTVKPIVKS